MNLDNNLKKIDLKNIPPTKDLMKEVSFLKMEKLIFCLFFHQLRCRKVWT